jgi:ankyrin repeat protein
MFLQDNYNPLHIAAMHSREDIVKILLSKKGVDPFASGGVSKGKIMTRD